MSIKKNFSVTWKKSKQPRKQHKYLYNAPLHVRQKLCHIHLSPELRKKYLRRSLQVRKGDKVRLLRGQYKKKEGKVEVVNLQRGKVFVSGIEFIKKDGSKIPIPLVPSNLMILELELNDKKRKQGLELKISSTSAKKSEKN